MTAEFVNEFGREAIVVTSSLVDELPAPEVEEGLHHDDPVVSDGGARPAA